MTNGLTCDSLSSCGRNDGKVGHQYGFVSGRAWGELGILGKLFFLGGNVLFLGCNDRFCASFSATNALRVRRVFRRPPRWVVFLCTKESSKRSRHDHQPKAAVAYI